MMVRLAWSRAIASRVAGIALAIAALAAAPGAAHADQTKSYGTKSCDRSAMAKSQSMEKGGLVDGSLVGGEIARTMKPADQSCIGWALGRAVTSATVTWDNPADKASYAVTLTRTYESLAGERCRDYILKAVIANRPQETNSTACLGTNGAWRLTVQNGVQLR